MHESVYAAYRLSSHRINTRNVPRAEAKKKAIVVKITFNRVILEKDEKQPHVITHDCDDKED
jgi:hypothetical protein